MSLHMLLRNSYYPVTRRYALSEEMVESEGALDGNLGRCMGYKPILDAAKKLVREDLGGVVFEGKNSKVGGELGGNYISGTKGSGTGSCRLPGGCCKDTPAGAAKSSAHESSSDETEIAGEASITETEEVPLSGATYGALPKTCGRDDCCQLPSVGNEATTEVDVLGGLKGFSIDEGKAEVVIGGNTSLTVLEMSKTHGEFPLLMKKFFLAYRTMALPADSIITKLTIPLPVEGTREVIKSYRQAKRKDDDIAIVTARFRVVLDEGSVVTDISLAYGAFDFPLGFTVPGGMPTYCKTLEFSFLFRFWHEVAAELGLGTQEQQVDHEVIKEIHRRISYGLRDNDNPYEQRVVGKQIPHFPGLKQATGEAEYIDDMPNIGGQLFGGLVLSKKAHVKLVKVDSTPALQVPDVIGVVDIKDLDDECNLWGQLRKASHSLRRTLCTRMEYFYLETNAAAVIPRPDEEEMEVWSSTQNIMETQEFVSQVTGSPSSRIVAKVKRMGGGFGGKESRSVQLAYILAVAAKKVGRPIRRMLSYDEDMVTSGQRNPFQTSTAMLDTLKISVTPSWTVHSRTWAAATGFRTFTSAAMSARQTLTAFRGFGAPQGHYIAECVLTAIADHLKISVDQLLLKNLYKEGQLTPFLQLARSAYYYSIEG
ncbi:molybdenum cofactor-binding domain-containing protein [Choiromyces venosus 120613-1]|uniref:Molybdenum cofactor-binding domain-containing protein n=1 Tax=Choiromyces venosus 120613-1 TaxID=1336337 RepID=A0A3N4J1G4_9PEZI|nr:molybdenum cofactor-binding domain-containing protein [Choiromyces venosus 120613-1]